MTAAERYDAAHLTAIKVAAQRAQQNPAGSGYPQFLREELREKVIAAIEAAVAEALAECFAEMAANDPQEAGEAAASEYVSSRPLGQRAWGQKELMIAKVAAGKAVAEERARCLAILDEGGWLGVGRSRIERGEFVQIATNRD